MLIGKFDEMTRVKGSFHSQRIDYINIITGQVNKSTVIRLFLANKEKHKI